MSTLATNAITDASGGNTASINSYTPTESNMAGRNRIINGAFQVWQRGTSFTGNFVNSYGADRWAQGNFQSGPQSRQTITQGQGPTSQYCIRISDTAATSSRSSVSQMIESVNSIDLAGQAVTLSFWIRFSASSRPGGSEFVYQLSEYDSVDPVHYSTGATRTNQTSIDSGSLPTVWTKFTQTITAASTMKNLGARFQFSSPRTASSEGDFWYEVAEVQIEAGSVATPFERRQYGQELALCQRYYFKMQATGASKFFAAAFNAATTAAVGTTFFPVTMRIAPSSLEQSGTAGDYQVRHSSTTTTCSTVPTFSVADIFSAATDFSVASGLTVGQGSALRSVNSSAYLAWSAEL